MVDTGEVAQRLLCMVEKAAALGRQYGGLLPLLPVGGPDGVGRGPDGRAGGGNPRLSGLVGRVEPGSDPLEMVSEAGLGRGQRAWRLTAKPRRSTAKAGTLDTRVARGVTFCIRSTVLRFHWRSSKM